MPPDDHSPIVGDLAEAWQITCVRRAYLAKLLKGKLRRQLSAAFDLIRQRQCDIRISAARAMQMASKLRRHWRDIWIRARSSVVLDSRDFGVHTGL